MGERFKALETKHIEFIRNQKIFFVGTAAKDGRVNISPKGLDTLKVLDNNTIIWLNLTGSGNETACHLLDTNRMTIMLCAFEGNPVILRAYGTAKTVHENDIEWGTYINQFSDKSGARQIFVMDIDLVQTSCGFGVPLFDYKQDRLDLVEWSERIGEQGIKSYWENKNMISIDGKTTDIKK